jgi:hypothetical protein
LSPMTALWFASVIGAALFFASGALSAEALQRILGVKPKSAPLLASSGATAHVSANQPPGANVPGEDAAAPDDRSRFAAFAANEVAQARSAAKTHRMEAEALRQQLDVEISTKAAIDRELNQSRAHVEDTSRRLAETQKAASLVPTLEKRLQEVEHAQATRARAAENAEERNRALERDLARARSELSRVETQLAARVNGQTLALEGELKRLNEEQQERTLRIKMLTERVAELTAYAEENTALRNERDALRRDVERLHRSTRDVPTPPTAPTAPTARVPVDPIGRSTISRPSQSGTTRRVHEPENTLEAGLKRHLSGLLAREPGVIAVLSDENGFPLAGVGSDQQQEGVSVLTSLAQELAFRVKEFVDLERIERLELADVAGRSLRVRLFDWETQPLALACLGRRSLVANPDEELVVTAFPKLLRKAWSA